MSKPDTVTREISPCKDCKNRHPACHDSCERYNDWKQRLEKVNEERKKYNARPFVKYNPFDY